MSHGDFEKVMKVRAADDHRRVFQNYYETHQLHDHTPSNIAWIGSLQSFFIFAGGLFGGPLFDRKGEKVGLYIAEIGGKQEFLLTRDWCVQVIYIPALVYIFSIMMTSISKEYYQFILAQGVLGGVAMGMVMSPSMAATPQYFHKKRGAAMGIAIAGSSIGGTIFPIALSKMFPNPRLNFGWSVRICGFIVMVLLAFACTGIKARLPPRQTKFFLPSAFKELPYVFLIASSFLMFLGAFQPYFFLPSFAVAHGMSTQLSNYLIAILNASALPGRVIPGLLADRFGRMNMFFAAGISSGILALCWQLCTTNATIIVFTALFGFFSGAIISGVSIGLASCPKDPKNIGTYMGMGMAFAALALLAGPPICGALVNHYHSYDQVAIFSGVVILAGSVTVLFAKQASEEGLLGKV